MTKPGTSGSGAQREPVTADFQPLFAYLKNRFADTVVLTFAQIEDLLGHPLPPPARAEQTWWANADTSGRSSTQARSWLRADRIATANLPARIVSFVRE